VQFTALFFIVKFSLSSMGLESPSVFGTDNSYINNENKIVQMNYEGRPKNKYKMASCYFSKISEIYAL